MSPWFLQVEAENRSNQLEPLSSAVRILHFFEHDIEFSYSNQVSMCFGGYPLVAPDESSNAPLDTFFGGWSFALYDLFGPGSSDCPDDDREQEKRKQCGDGDRYD